MIDIIYTIMNSVVTPLLVFVITMYISAIVVTAIFNIFYPDLYYIPDSQVDNRPKTREEKERDSNWSFKMVWGKCPYCREEISRGAVRCPKCTANLDPTRNNGK